MRIVAVIPVHGRLPLLPYTIGRLYQKNKVDHVICVGSENERLVCEKAGAQFIVAPNTLGLKWNNGFEEARNNKADAVLFVGSSDWLSDNWVGMSVPYLEYYSMIGKLDFNLIHVSSKILLSHWPGYPAGNPRYKEPIGIGRMIRADVLDKMKWRPFIDSGNVSMDYMMLKNVERCGGTVGAIDDKIYSLSISTDIWENKHKFFELGTMPIPNGKQWLMKYFPEAFKFHADINNR